MPDEVEAPNPPKVTVIKNGKAVDTSAIDNYDSFMAFLMQASQAANIAKIRKYYDDRTSIGREENFELSITPATQEIVLAYPAQSFYIINDGPGQIFVEINGPGFAPNRLLPHDKKEINFETHKLKKFSVWSAAGTTATARATAKF
ncbi:MAG: hypothetical protein ACUVTR_02010 [Dehalococcoidia bacterium]